MLLVIPISAKTPQADKLADALKRRGGYQGHVLRVITSREDEETGYLIGDALSDSFDKVTTEALPPLADKEKGFSAKAVQTLLANRMLKAAFRFFEGYEYPVEAVQNAPMMYFNPLYRPSAQGWLDELQAEFFLKGAPGILARTVSTEEEKSETTWTDRNRKRDMKHLTVGPVIFGRKSIGAMPMINFLDEKLHWRERMMHEINSLSVGTKQIGPGGKSLLREIPSDKLKV